MTTIDANGVLGRDNTIRPAIASLQAKSREANGGIAAAMAMGGTQLPANAKFAVSLDVSTYRGEQGFSAGFALRAPDNITISGGLAGSTVKDSAGGRVGMTFAW